MTVPDNLIRNRRVEDGSGAPGRRAAGAITGLDATPLGDASDTNAQSKLSVAIARTVAVLTWSGRIFCEAVTRTRTPIIPEVAGNRRTEGGIFLPHR